VEKSEGNALLAAAETGPVLIELSEDRAAPPRPPGTTGLYHTAIRFPSRHDLAYALQRLVRNNYPLQGAADHLVSEALYLSDPERNGVELYADRPRAQWVWNNGEVVMSTEALNLSDLLATIKGEAPAASPPSETDLGHIHLQVADLNEAERFYHKFLGLAVTQRSYPGALFFSAGGYPHHIAVNTWAAPDAPPANSVGLISYRLKVPSADILSFLGERAPVFGYEAQMVKLSKEMEILEITDPNGNTLEIASV
jgi:catechol 2,3-dioxygenase